MRGLLIVNPQATTTTGHGAELVVRALDGVVDLAVEKTRYRGHARELAAATDRDLVVVFGGDGVINEAVNGLMEWPRLGERPLFAVIPGGGGNVFARALGLPLETGGCVRRLRQGLAAGSSVTIGLGLAAERYFTFSAGLGLDAEVVHEVDRLRAQGRRESPGLYMWVIARSLRSGGRDRPAPTLTLERAGPVSTGASSGSLATSLAAGVVTNSAPWTYVWGRPLRIGPGTGFRSGLDVLALRQTGAPTVLGLAARLMLGRLPHGRQVVTVHGADTAVFSSTLPIAFHVDGEYLGEMESVKFQFVADALRVVA